MQVRIQISGSAAALRGFSRGVTVVKYQNVHLLQPGESPVSPVIANQP